jgi:hypothetical protein
VVISDASAQAIAPLSLTPGSVTVTGAPLRRHPSPEAIPVLPLWGLGPSIMLMLIRMRD